MVCTYQRMNRDAAQAHVSIKRHNTAFSSASILSGKQLPSQSLPWPMQIDK